MPIPRRPLLAPWYRLVGDGDRLLLEHGQVVVVLEGAAVRTLLPALLPLLDGTRTVDELVDRLGAAAREAIELALATLASHRPDADVAVVAPAGDELDALPTWNRDALRWGARWLPVRPFDGRFAQVGPLV